MKEGTRKKIATGVGIGAGIVAAKLYGKYQQSQFKESVMEKFFKQNMISNNDKSDIVGYIDRAILDGSWYSYRDMPQAFLAKFNARSIQPVAEEGEYYEE